MKKRSVVPNVLNPKAGDIYVMNKYDVDKNLRSNPKYLVMDIMRPNVLGNPFKVFGKMTRGKAIESYRLWLWNEICKGDSTGHMTPLLELLKALSEDKKHIIILECCCAPQPCHGDVLKRCIEWMRSRK